MAGGSARHALSLYPAATARSLVFLGAFSLLLSGLTASLRAEGIRRLSERLTILAVLMALIAIV